MRKWTVAVILLVLVIASFAVVNQVMAEKYGQPNIDICHFEDHEAEDGTPDYAITGPGLVCLDKGGQIITVALPAACNGHGVPNLHCE